MDMLSYSLDYNQTLHISLAIDVKNVPAVMDAVLKGVLKCALIKPTLIIDAFQIVVAANKAVVALNNGNLSSRNVYTETIYNLSPAKTIKSALEEFGVKDEKDFLICVIGNHSAESTKVAEDVCNFIEGTFKFPSAHELKNFCNTSAIIKRYNVSADELNVSDLLSSIVTKISSKGFK